MKLLKALGVVSVTGVGLYALAIATMGFAEKGFDYIASPVEEEAEAPVFEITDDMIQEAEEKIGEVVEEIESELNREQEEESEPTLSEEIPEPIWIGDNPNLEETEEEND